MSNTFGNLESEKTVEDGTVKKAVLKEIKRVLKPNGKLIVSVYQDTPASFTLRKESYISIGLYPYPKNNKIITTKEGLVSEQFSEKEIRELLEKQGLSVEQIIPFNDIAFCVIATAT